MCEPLLDFIGAHLAVDSGSVTVICMLEYCTITTGSSRHVTRYTHLHWSRSSQAGVTRYGQIRSSFCQRAPLCITCDISD